ncbi:MAG: UDP-N-acetylmuramate dehydrogenase [Bacteroidetes bacterium]|nr:MAG: UDP-N-acetylmuramate dehydrogenase [Bacteroidota bacterium]MBL1145600.1 UDP-N-acetylmuramate dehydrogenase [Bacteroidota bacterium]NOG58396.1 UDP-N-acetylmuramate dehydrogenase [Bacteroidota bacterium]
MKFAENVDLKPFNTFGIEAKANQFVEINSREEAITLIKEQNLTNLKHLILGGGSNILLTENFEGLIIKNNIKGIKVCKSTDDSVVLEVGAGENWHEFVMYCIDNNYCGVENLSLIPGCVGASPMQNIGAYGVEVKDLIESVETIALNDGKVTVFQNADCAFDYRSSIFKTTHKNQYLICSVKFKLSKKPVFNVSYGAIEKELEKQGVTANKLSIKAVSEAVIAIRQSKLPDPKKIGNSGSFFKNPVVDEATFKELKAVYKDMPAYELPIGGYKLAAGWLIEKAGWKGYTDGNYGVHKNQALVLVNYGGASGKLIYNLSERIVRDIRRRFGVELEREVNII